MAEETIGVIFSAVNASDEVAFATTVEAGKKIFPIDWTGLEGFGGESLAEEIIRRSKAAYEAKEHEIGTEALRHLEGMILLDLVDSKWKEHLRSMDNLREGIHLRGYGQKDPLVEYKREAYDAFSAMIAAIKEDALAFIFRVQPLSSERRAIPVEKKETRMKFLHPEAQSAIESLTRSAEAEQAGLPSSHPVVNSDKIGRNDPCHCGSGKKFKKCHGQ